VDGSSNPNCAGGADGFINLSVSGGKAPYTYAWTNGATTEDISGLSAGIYAITITDARGCKVVLDAQLTDPERINISINSSDPSCPEESGSIDISITGGTAPYRYIWNNGATTQDIDNATAGNYQVNVTDALGCSQLSENISINSPNDFNVKLTPIDVKCYGLTNGEVLLDIDGSGAYTFAWSNGDTTASISNIGIGTYTVSVTDANGCTSSCTVELLASTINSRAEDSNTSAYQNRIGRSDASRIGVYPNPIKQFFFIELHNFLARQNAYSYTHITLPKSDIV